jgi:phospholipase/lecithinase/hemolysin
MKISKWIMTFMGKSCALALATFSLAQANTAHRQTHYDHVIIFGDSLSDIGNMPMSPSLIEPNTGVIALNLFVPISNPVVPDGNLYQVPLTHHYVSYPQPSPTLSPFLNVDGNIFPRNYKSLNWAQFFVHLAQQDGLITDQQNLVPWVWWKQYSNAVRSINFAFAGATSEDLCRDFQYQHPTSDCTSDTIFNAQIPYRLAGFSQEKSKAHSITLVQVPGVEKQVSLFLDAVKQHPALASPNTLYIIFVGGNDLNLALYNLSKHHYGKAFGALLHGTQNNVRQAIIRLHDQAGARNIVIMNLFDMRLTPYLHTNLPRIDHLSPKQANHLLTLAHLAVALYNHQLHRIVSNFNNQQNEGEPLHLTYFDTYQALDQMASSPPFNAPQTLYHMCLQTSYEKADDYTAQNTCISHGAYYLFWNGTHPSIYVGEYVGYALDNQLKG